MTLVTRNYSQEPPLIDLLSPRLFDFFIINRRCGNQTKRDPKGFDYGSQKLFHDSVSTAQ